MKTATRRNDSKRVRTTSATRKNTPQPTLRMQGLENVLAHFTEPFLLAHPNGTIIPFPAPASPRPVAGCGSLIEHFIPASNLDSFLHSFKAAIRSGKEQFLTIPKPGSQASSTETIRVFPILTTGRRIILLVTWPSSGQCHNSLDLIERERRAIGREIHDNLCQELLFLGFSATRLYRALASQQFTTEAEQAAAIGANLQRLLGHARSISHHHTTSPIHPHQFIPALRGLASDVSTRCEVTCSVSIESHPPITTPELATHLYRIVQEAVSNAIRHGRASAIQITTGQAGGTWHICVRDNGCGFDNSTTVTRPKGIGIENMTLRARLIGASFSIHSRPEKGTEIRCDFAP